MTQERGIGSLPGISQSELSGRMMPFAAGTTVLEEHDFCTTQQVSVLEIVTEIVSLRYLI